MTISLKTKDEISRLEHFVNRSIKEVEDCNSNFAYTIEEITKIHNDLSNSKEYEELLRDPLGMKFGDLIGDFHELRRIFSSQCQCKRTRPFIPKISTKIINQPG